MPDFLFWHVQYYAISVLNLTVSHLCQSTSFVLLFHTCQSEGWEVLPSESQCY